MGVRDLILRYGIRAKVMHRLPGRIRLKVEALRKIPAERQEFAAGVLRSLPMPSGVKAVEPSLVTANILVSYESEQISETRIIEHTDWLIRLLAANWERLAEIPPDDPGGVLEKLSTYLRSRDGKGAESGREVEIPEDVWS
ncbi:HMA2 domain-containing protein [Thermodesulfobacteriota bacterium]